MLTPERKKRAEALYRNLEKFAGASNLENAILIFHHRSGDSGVIGISDKNATNEDKIYKPLLEAIADIMKEYKSKGFASELTMKDGKIIDPQEN